MTLGPDDAQRGVLGERLRGLLAEGPGPEGILSLLGLVETPFPGAPSAPAGVVLNMLLLQALGDAGVRAPLWCATQGGVLQDARESSVSAEQAAVWGWGRVAALEHPQRWGGLIDLPERVDEAAVGHLLGILCARGPEDQVAVRASGVWGRRLRRSVPTAADDWAFPSGTVLITGGTGALGRHTARWLAAGGVESLVLVSRSGMAAPGARALVRELTGSGTLVSVVAADVSDRQAMAEVLAAVPQEYPLAGIVHTAGTLDDGLIDVSTPENLATVFRPKAEALRVLHEMTAGLPLSMFVAFSSGAATFGNAGQSGYAAANAYLDAFMQWRRAQGLVGTSIAWGFWDGDGLPSRSQALKNLHRSGAVPMPPESAVLGMRQALERDDVVITIADVDWARLGEVFTAARPSPLLAELLPPSGRGTGEGGTAEDDDPASRLRERLAKSSGVERVQVLVDIVRRQVAAVLGHTDSVDITATRTFKDLGFNSLTAVEVRNALGVATGLSLPATLVFDHPTPNVLAEHLVGLLMGDTAAVTGTPAVVAPGGADEPIAIVGLACRLPGGASGPDEFWDLLVSEVDAVAGFPTDRGWDLEALRTGRSVTESGAFLQDATEFDAAFFGISPREALAMDPQQRLVLETSWEALEHAGLPPTTLRGSRTGVFIGAAARDYPRLLTDSRTDSGGYLTTGSASSVLSGRVSYCLGLEGPAVTVDTACSSSLVALHWATQSLRSHECDFALVGGVAVISDPLFLFEEFSRQNVLAADGRCKAFAEGADGTGWAEGVGMVAVERLSDARAKGHRVLAVVRGSAVNQDGASNGLSAPNGPSQQRVIQAALENAGLAPSDVDAVEAHGTGTALGDPIEAQALLATYGRERAHGDPLWLGSVKSNIGHTQTASGIVGVIKMVLAMRHGLLPRTLHVEQPSTHVDWASGEVRLLTERTAWPRTGRPRRAGVSSFGISGTNAHVIVEQAPSDESAEEPTTAQPGWDSPPPLLLSARDEAALRAQARRLTAMLAARPELDLLDVGYSLATSRAALEHGAAVTAGDRDGLLAGLTALAEGQAVAGVVRAMADADGRRPVFVFPGQGAHWPGMAAELLDTSPVFTARLRECAQALAPYLSWSLEDAVRGTQGAPSLDRPDVVQPVLFAVMVSLAAVWRAYGVEPAAVVGHSQGEIAAACVAGALSLEDAARIVALRSRALTALRGRGGMLSVVAPNDRVRELLQPWRDKLAIAAVNGPSSITVSGDAAALEEFEYALVEARVPRWRLDGVDFAAHSPQVAEIHQDVMDALAGVRSTGSAVPFYSTVTGGLLDTADLDARYWYTNLRQTVRFAEAVGGLLGQGHRLFVDCGPHPALNVGLHGCFEEAGVRAAVVPTLRRGDGGPDRLLAALAEAHIQGVGVDWEAVYAGTGAGRVELPTYAFQRRRFWPGPARGVSDVRAVGLTPVDHPLLGAGVELPGAGGWVFSGRLSLQAQPWLDDHRVEGVAVFPGSGLVEIVSHAAQAVGCARIDELVLHAPLVVQDQGGVQVQVAVSAADEADGRAVTVYARPDGAEHEDWTCHARGALSARWTQDAGTPVEQVWPPVGAVAVDTGGFYERASATGIAYGPVFQ
ncbi:type I polyketide synthase, partial [Streptomyces olivaceoviridis]|uniref:type I polyketide synthase n=1 Tax=Streptomyces olivaceoviridis TaxID=1921 RepID=UPI0036FDC83C